MASTNHFKRLAFLPVTSVVFLLLGVVLTSCEPATPGAKPATLREHRWPQMRQALFDEWKKWNYQVVDLRPDASLSDRCRVTRRGVIDDDVAMAKHISAVYWRQTLGLKRSVEEVRCEHRSDGKGSFTASAGTPWSAAFISYVFKAGGVSAEEFEGSDAHWKYLQHIQRRNKELQGTGQQADFVIHASTQRIPQVGDLICAPRGCNPHFTLSNLAGNAHCDIVVEADFDLKIVKAIGGNVQDGVTLTITPLDANNHLIPVDVVRPWLLVVENRLAAGHMVVPLPTPQPPISVVPQACSNDRALDIGVCGKGFVQENGLENDKPLEACPKPL